jgi:hypothetical protein
MGLAETEDMLVAHPVKKSANKKGRRRGFKRMEGSL